MIDTEGARAGRFSSAPISEDGLSEAPLGANGRPTTIAPTAVYLPNVRFEVHDGADACWCQARPQVSNSPKPSGARADV